MKQIYLWPKLLIKWFEWYHGISLLSKKLKLAERNLAKVKNSQILFQISRKSLYNERFEISRPPSLSEWFNFESSKFTLDFTNTNFSLFFVLIFFLGGSSTYIYFLLVETRGGLKDSENFQKLESDVVWPKDQCCFKVALQSGPNWKTRCSQIRDWIFPPSLFRLVDWPNKLIKILAFVLARLSL